MSHRIGIVVETHHKDHSVDLVMADDGSRLVGVQVLTSNGSKRSGSVDMPEVKPVGDKWNITKEHGQDMKAIVAFVGPHPVVVGFLFPQVNQMLLKDPKIQRYRHQSDVETLIDGDGNVQVTHPCGTYIRIGEDPQPDKLVGKFVDKSKTDRNLARQVHVRIGMAGGTAVLTIAPNGAVSLTTQSTVDVEAAGAVRVTAPSVTLDTPLTTCTGSLVVQGATSLMAVSSRGKDISSTHRHLNSGGSNTGGVPT